MPIHVLSDAVVSRIAAGEVVERPASVVKEMIENALDAAASEIKIECLEGGRRMIRITDNGHGIRSSEIELAFAHHATSKLQSADDLDTIKTLGFRGEALASIASVSVVSCASRHVDDPVGSLIRVDGGVTVEQDQIGRPQGTTMTVEHLFGRIPARLKFLKSNQTERGHLDGVVMRYAMAYPQVRFALTQDGRSVIQTSGNGSLRDVLIEVTGSLDVQKMAAIEQPESAESNHSPRIRVNGFVGLPELTHNSRSKVAIFVNGRPVQDVRLATAVVQAYHTLLMVGRYPVAVVMVQVPSDEVDVNVHPAKSEVRFTDANAVFGAIQRAVRNTLLTHSPVTEAPSSIFDVENRIPTPAIGGSTAFAIQLAADQTPLSGSHSWERVGIQRNAVPGAQFAVPDRSDVSRSGLGPATLTPAPQPGAPIPHPGTHLPALRLLGQLALTYIIAEGPEGLYLIDQHAAHERVLFERVMAQVDLGTVVSQPLLDPVPVEVPPDSARVLDDQLPTLRDLGFDMDRFGGNTFLVRSVPSVMMQDDVAGSIREIVADIESSETPLRKDMEARVLRRVCKRMAIKAGRVLALAEMQALVRDLEACESPRTCPHGRPTMIQISSSALEKQFGRMG